jgi:hypothetical protein
MAQIKTKIVYFLNYSRNNDDLRKIAWQEVASEVSSVS